MTSRVTGQRDREGVLEGLPTGCGGGGEVPSCSAEKNTGIQAVQFVFRTAAIAIEQPPVEPIPEVQRSLIDRIKALFGL